MINASVSPTISQMILSLNNPQQTNFNVGTANLEANAGSVGSVQIDASSSATCVGTSCGGSVDTFA
ncbi:MAG: hypothetical protein PHD53_12010 [Methylococcales bacterium]|nr:hypothetical protein [Methylococcales bacterium]